MKKVDLITKFYLAASLLINRFSLLSEGSCSRVTLITQNPKSRTMKTIILSIIIVFFINTMAYSQVVLNEVYPEPGSDKNEFFELYNTSTSNIPESLDNYTLVSYYEELGKTGFYVLDMPNLFISAKNYFTASSSNPFNIQGQNNLKANISWNSLSGTAALTKWEKKGSNYNQMIVPSNLIDLFVKKTGNGANYHILLFKNGVLINGLMAGTSSATIPNYITSMPALPVNMTGSSPDFSISFATITPLQVEFVGSNTGSNNGYIRTRDGKCGDWKKSSAQIQHTPGNTNGSAANSNGEITVDFYITSLGGINDPSMLNYNVVAAPSNALPVTIEAYVDYGTIAQLDSSDILFHSRAIINTTSGLQQIIIPDNYSKVILVIKSAAGCYDAVKVSTKNNITLPVELVSFSAMLYNEKVDIKWTTASEKNVSHFSIEKSTDGKNYNEAGLVFAYGNTSETINYSFTDKNISTSKAGVIYYRLRSVDKDGKSELSQVRSIRIGKKNEQTMSIVTYPNPVSSELRITIPANWQGKKVSYELFNHNGQVTIKNIVGASSQTEAMNVNSFAPGFYIVKVTCNGEIAQQKIFKR